MKHRATGKDGEYYAIHEVHYNADGKEIGMAVNPATFIGDSPEEVRSSLILAKSDSSRRPVFEMPESWANPLPAIDELSTTDKFQRNNIESELNDGRRKDSGPYAIRRIE